ncbi:hypothetical protein M758_3G141900 [Ceratodon purpureus]|nr:hypothetical protein M758_3G141900 [Ceratodon purpureus]
MASVACQVQCGAFTLNRSAAVSACSRRASSPPSAFFASEVHASCSSISFSSGKSALNVASRRGAAARQRKRDFVVCGLFGLGAPELVVIAGVAALLFGPKQLPQLGKKLGQSVKSFQQAAKEFESEVKGDSDESQGNSEISEEKKETITPTPVATPSKTENKSS